MKKSYLDRLARWALWRLPRQEAESILADYQDLVQSQPGSEEELTRRLGKPQDVVELLTDSRNYTVWLAVFLLLSLCALAPCLASVNSAVWIDHGEAIGFGLSAVGTLGVLVWFRRHGKKERQAPRALFLALGALAAWCLGVLFFNWLWMHDTFAFVRATQWLTPYIGSAISAVYRVCGVAAALAGVWGLIKARTGDRRWIAVYIMALAAVLLVMEPMVVMMTLSDAPDGWYLPHLRQYIAIFMAGLIGTGFALH